MEKKPFADFFKDKTVTLMGLGLLGRGIGDAAFLARHCKKVYVTDAKSETDLRASVEALKEFKNIEFHLGGHNEKLFENKDFIVKAAGVRLDNPFIAHARKNGIPVYMSTALFVHLYPIKTVGVTGTRGKTTTTCMIADILKRAGKKILLGGNLRGISTLAQLPDASNYDYAVLELDSWQLQGFDDLKISPNVGVFTTFYPDHMNYYDGDMDRYFRDKAAVFMHQKKGDTFVAPSVVAEIAKKELPEAARQAEWIVANALPPSFALRIPGAHNLTNAGAAKTAALACGADEETANAALRDFNAVEGRLQYVSSWQGRKFYNDSNATTQEATLAALTAFPASAVVLIFGGADKGLPIDKLTGYIATNAIRNVLIAGTGSDRVLKDLPNLRVARSMPEAFEAAVAVSKEGDAIVLSPGFASFGVFKNEYDRSDQYMNEISKITKGDACRR